ncbi:thiamine-phosphate pyrophosphorylase [Desulfonispora thiosulfatigenes DSM 11270]|uniref:Thiamine-phosphate pyrophosphorylase n=1 Tax=Desulfonispora thiosulfatigenes DSM 11270 TaxID=656914 RepID=A0A1W1V2P7_DESTI|nr:thiamine phosphate synthase [Desulfonispora thiosulfatigenes]SMB87301.1 thiamine-phosphate pyrophosphorylase [Desulfonispora thiosulfatigenes DSM 11270]
MIYFITNRKLVSPERFLPIIEEAVKAGVGSIILREKDLNSFDLLQLAIKVKAITKGTNTSLIINENLKVAREIKATGIQISFTDFMNDRTDFTGIIGVSVHSLEEALTASKNGASYLLASHIFPTDCKKGLAPRGIKWLEKITSRVQVPVIALGGINIHNLSQVFKAGATGAALMSEIMQASDVHQKIKNLHNEYKLLP